MIPIELCIVACACGVGMELAAERRCYGVAIFLCLAAIVLFAVAFVLGLSL